MTALDFLLALAFCLLCGFGIICAAVLIALFYEAYRYLRGLE